MSTSDQTRHWTPGQGGLSQARGQLTGQARDLLRADIAALRATEPGISVSEIGRRLAPKYGIKSRSVRNYA